MPATIYVLDITNKFSSKVLNCFSPSRIALPPNPRSPLASGCTAVKHVGILKHKNKTGFVL